jgi:SAM-dependent methyltransferase
MTWPMTHRLVGGMSLSPGDRVLDVGCGTGDTTLALAMSVGSSGSVVAIDPVEAMIHTARSRAAALDLSGIDFRVTAIEEAAFPAADFAGVCARWSLIFCEDIVAQLRRIHDWLIPGGRLALAAWTPQRETPGFEAINLALNRQIALPPLDTSKPGRIHLSEPGQLETALESAGFTHIRIEPVPLSIVTRDGEEFWQMMCAMGGALSRILDGLTEAHRQAVRADVIAAVETHRVDDTLRIPAPARAAFAERPSRS